MICNVCQNELGDPIFKSPTNRSLTSLCEVTHHKINIWACNQCGHIRGEPLPDTEQYYASDYRILLDSDDEDQIYLVDNERIIYRTDHQVSTLLNKINLPKHARLLDFGCAKASTPRRLLSQRNDLQVHLFDVSDMYTGFWNEFLSEDRWAIDKIPTDWSGTFEIVTSFFALEHIPDPIRTVHKVVELLDEEGIFYGIVPDTFGNIADFVVADHVNHFTKTSLYTLLQNSGFSHVEIDNDAHRGALVFIAKKSGKATEKPEELQSSLKRAVELAEYWTNLGNRIRSAERANEEKQAAIYGAGFYGAYITSTLNKPEQLKCILDANPYQQGKKLLGYDIISPAELPKSVELLYIGLNPTIARETIKEINWIHKRNLEIIFLDEEKQ